MLTIRWDAEEVPDFQALLARVPDATLNSPRRSVVPLLDFWRDPAASLPRFARIIGIDLSAATDLNFEHAVPVQKGQGKASYTDLMILTPDAAVAVEAKYTEPEYENVRTWLRDRAPVNRLDVLDGWLGLINRLAAAPVKREDVLDLPYQLIHRTASACHPDRATRALVYLIFGENPAAHYSQHLETLRRLIAAPHALSMMVLACPTQGLPRFEDLTAMWDAGQRELAQSVRSALAEGPLFTFGELRRSGP